MLKPASCKFFQIAQGSENVICDKRAASGEEAAQSSWRSPFGGTGDRVARLELRRRDDLSPANTSFFASALQQHGRSTRAVKQLNWKLTASEKIAHLGSPSLQKVQGLN